jgi:hypothetical protein
LNREDSQRFVKERVYGIDSFLGASDAETVHTAAYWLMLAMRSAVPTRSPLSTAESATIRLRLIKIAGRVVEGAAAASPSSEALAATRVRGKSHAERAQLRYFG